MKFKRLISLVLAIAMLLSITAGLNLTAYAETFKDGDFEYEVQSDDTVKITKYIGDALDGVENVEIPEQIEGKIVTAVGKGAFTADYFASSEILCSTLKLPKTVISFSNSCFDKFYFSSYEVVEENEYFSSVDGVLFNKDKTALLCYPPNKLRNGIAEYEIPYGVTTIGENAFYHMTSNAISWIVFPETVTEIKENFLACEFLSELKFYNRNEFEIDSQVIDNLKSNSIYGDIYGYYSSASYQLSKALDKLGLFVRFQSQTVNMNTLFLKTEVFL